MGWFASAQTCERSAVQPGLFWSRRETAAGSRSRTTTRLVDSFNVLEELPGVNREAEITRRGRRGSSSSSTSGRVNSVWTGCDGSCRSDSCIQFHGESTIISRLGSCQINKERHTVRRRTFPAALLGRLFKVAGSRSQPQTSNCSQDDCGIHFNEASFHSRNSTNLLWLANCPL